MNDCTTLVRGEGEIAVIRTEELDMWLGWGWVTEETRAEELAAAAEADAAAKAAEAAKPTKAPKGA